MVVPIKKFHDIETRNARPLDKRASMTTGTERRQKEKTTFRKSSFVQLSLVEMSVGTSVVQPAVISNSS